MLLSAEDLIRIVEDSSTISERRGEDFLTPEFNENSMAAGDRLNKWCQAAAKGDMKKFQERLSRDGIEITEARQLLGGVCLRDKNNLPSWVKILTEVLRTADKMILNVGSHKTIDTFGFLEPQVPLPFEELLIPFVFVAQSKLRLVLGPVLYGLLNKKSHLALQRMLLEGLSRIAAPSLFMHFAWFKNCSGYNSPFSFLIKTKPNSPADECYQAFIKDMLEGGLVPFLKEYPVVARLAASQTEQWIDTVSEFVKRLASDWDEISTKFGMSKNIEQVVQVTPGLSDEHNHGHTVYGLTFASGLKLIYKPKDIGIETAYFNFLNWLNDHHASFSFKAIKTLDRSSYGWVEFVEHLPCNTGEGLKTYYYRAGHLLAVVYALRGTDCHYENIIACGEYPVLIDTEMLLYPRIPKLAGLKTSEQEKAYEKSILNTGLLPQGDLIIGNKIVDASGLAGCCDQEKYQVPVWKNVNTDEMSYEHDYRNHSKNHNIPCFEGQAIPPRDYVEQIINGFVEVYKFMVQNRQAILSQDGPLASMQDKKLRFILRSTWIYYNMLMKTLEPKYMHNSADRSIEIERFAYSMLNADSVYWPLLQAEVKALVQLDIPYFSFIAKQNAIEVSADKIVENCLPETAYKLANRHIGGLNDTDMQMQTNLIRAAFAVRYFEQPLINQEGDFSLLQSEVIALSQDELWAEAAKIAKELKEYAIKDHKEATWIQIEPFADSNGYKIQPASFGLYNGRCGIALFLAAIFKVNDETEYRDLASAALHALREVLNGSGAEIIARVMGIGLAEGLGSVIYSLVKISEFLNDNALLQDAHRAASLITPDMINEDQTLDVIGGAAGAILGLLSLYNVSNNLQVLEKAIKCGNHLVKNWVINESDLSKSRALTGFSHGAAGIAYALICLYEITGQAEVLQLAQQAVAYEQSVFCAEEANWPDFRPTDDNAPAVAYMRSWCHGAPGIGLARIGGLSVLNNELVWADIEVSLKTTRETDLRISDNLCCGNFGLVDILLTAAQKLSRPDLKKAAIQRTSLVVARQRVQGQFQYNWPQALPIWGLFQGRAGIGYELLRLAYPELFKSLLLLE